MKASNYLDYFKRVIAQEVHLRGIESFEDFSKQEQKQLLNECQGFFSQMIKEENQAQYGRQSRRI